jgi:hypothetical protein
MREALLMVNRITDLGRLYARSKGLSLSLRSIAYVCAMSVIVTACGGTASTSTVGGCNNPPQPFAQLLYPIPGSKNIEVNAGVLIIGARNEDPVPWLTSGGRFLYYPKRVPLPSPLPQPELTPAPGTTLYAAALRPLRHKTQYSVSVTLDYAYCDPFGAPKKLGSFTTQ